MLLQAVFIPVVGILGNDFDRVLLICIGSVVWGAMSTGFGFARDLKQVLCSCTSLRGLQLRIALISSMAL